MFGNDFSHVLEGVQSKSTINSNSPNEGREEGVCESSIRTGTHFKDRFGFDFFFSNIK